MFSYILYCADASSLKRHLLCSIILLSKVVN